jgi:hypothetical protein
MITNDYHSDQVFFFHSQISIMEEARLVKTQAAEMRDIDWMIYEDVDTAMTIKKFVPASSLKTTVYVKQLNLPTARFQSWNDDGDDDEDYVGYFVGEPKEMTVLEVLTMIQSYYRRDHNLSKMFMDMEGVPYDEVLTPATREEAEVYADELTFKTKANRANFIADCMSNKYKPSMVEGKRRHPFLQSGLTRFEGLTPQEERGVYMVDLGS